MGRSDPMQFSGITDRALSCIAAAVARTRAHTQRVSCLQVEPDRYRRRLAARAHAELVENRRDVVSNRFGRKEKLPRDICIAQTPDNERKYLDFSRSETSEVLPGRGVGPAAEAAHAPLAQAAGDDRRGGARTETAQLLEASPQGRVIVGVRKRECGLVGAPDSCPEFRSPHPFAG